MPTKHQVEVGGRRLTLTNLDKVMYPGDGFTKAHVIEYYTRVSEWILPHLARRPVTLHRFPEGVGGQAFYEKDAPKFTPEWVHTTDVPRVTGGKPIRYVCVDDLSTLVWCANIASLELHPFLHRAGELDRPTSLVFDLDPGEGAGLVSCAEAAVLLRESLQEKLLECFPKVSGSKGIQVYAPLNTAVTYEASRGFAKALAQRLEKEHPKLIVSEMAKELRPGKVFIDWSQNSDFKTTVGVYSLRAKKDVAYVSAPLTWAEIAALRKKRDEEAVRFRPDALVKRVTELGDLFAPLLSMKQRLPKEGVAKCAAAKKAAPVVKVPEFVEPMLLLRTNQLPEGEEWLYEVKLDGYRALAAKRNGKVELRSRNDKDFSARFATIAEALSKMPDETMIDGEVVALDEEGRPAFNLLQNYGSAPVPIVYYAFDVLVLRGKDMMGEPVVARREALEREVLTKLKEPIRYSPELVASLPDLVRSVKAQGLEGLVAKRRDSVYEPGRRSGAWQKMRVNQGQELVIGGYTPGPNNFDALIIGYYEDGKLMYAARTRNGFTPAVRAKLFERLRKLEIKTCPFANLPEKSGGRWGQGLTAAKMQECRWLKPVTVAQFEFVEWTPENHLRHAKFIGLREDKDAREVGREA